MKTRGKLALTVLLAGGLAFQAHGQSVTLGDATFDENSAQPDATGYYPMAPLQKVQTCTGYGDYEGFVKTLKFSIAGDSAEGVKCLSRTVIGSSLVLGVSDLIEPNGLRVATPEVACLAVDTSGNVRVLALSNGGSASFTASATVTPPILMPASPSAGQSWNVLGKKITVVDVNASTGGQDSLLKLKVEDAPEAPGGVEAPPVTEEVGFEYRYYKAGSGLVAVESSASDAAGGSGWTVAE